MKIVFIADFFAEQVLGGGELNNEEFISIAGSLGFSVQKIQSHFVTVEFLKRNKSAKFIVANFINLHESVKRLLLSYEFVIYEHDHKYLKSRNPQIYKDFLAPKHEIINYEFYKNAKAIFCQSKFHFEIINKNLHLNNLINLSGNLWASSAIELIRSFASVEKLEKCSIMDSPISHKNTRQAVMFCKATGREYELIPSLGHEEFLRKISKNKTLVFFPKTPETLSRIAVEARMMGMSVITNELIGAAHEPWYNKKGLPLIEEVEKMRDRIPNRVLETLNE